MPIKRYNQAGDIARCEYCGRKIKFDSRHDEWFHCGSVFPMTKCKNKSALLVPVKPDNVWRLAGTLGPRADGRRYYIYHNYATEQIHYKWDLEFWLPTSAYKLMSEALPMTKVSPLGTPGY